MDRTQEEPEGVDLLVAVRRRVWAFVIPIVLVVGGCIAFGFVRDPVYTAETRLSVGRLDIATQGIAGFSQAEIAIATALSRAVVAPAVIEPAARTAGVSVGKAADAVGASPIAGAPLIRVEAKITDAKKAVALANATADELVAYAKQLGTTGGDVKQLSARYASIAREVSRLFIARARLQKIFNRHQTTLNRQKLQGAEGKLAQRILQRNAVGNVYSAQASGLTAANLLGVLAPAYRASSDKTKVIEELGASGLIAGLILGLAVVGLLEAGARRREADAATTA